MASTSVGVKEVKGFLKRIIGTPLGQMIPLTNSVVTIGRAKKSDVHIDDPNISRSHFTLYYEYGSWHITDLGGRNGTYLGNHKLKAHTRQPLRDGLGIYIGHPDEAHVAFVFIKNKHVPTPKEEQKNLQKEIQSLNDKTKNRLRSTRSTRKRRAKVSVHSSQSNKDILSTSTNQPLFSQSTTDGQDLCDKNHSDDSICTLDDLVTRIRKSESKKRKMEHSSNRIDDSTSYNPCVPSTSSAGQGTSLAVDEKLTKLKKTIPDVFNETLFNDSGDSLTETAHEIEVSESFLEGSILSTHRNPYQSYDPELQHPTNQRNAASKPQQNSNLENSHEELRKEHAMLLKEYSEQKQKLNQIMKDSGKLSEMLEEEFMCSICYEVFIKATILGCSHTFCEHCLCIWKKNNKLSCPVCREIITTETRILFLDNFMEKVVGKLDKDFQAKRKEVVAIREAANMP